MSLITMSCEVEFLSVLGVSGKWMYGLLLEAAACGCAVWRTLGRLPVNFIQRPVGVGPRFIYFHKIAFYYLVTSRIDFTREMFLFGQISAALHKTVAKTSVSDPRVS